MHPENPFNQTTDYIMLQNSHLTGRKLKDSEKFRPVSANCSALRGSMLFKNVISPFYTEQSSFFQGVGEGISFADCLEVRSDYVFLSV